MIFAKVSSKGQITLPKRVRQALNVKAGERVMFLVEDKDVVLKPIGPSTARALAGSLGDYAPARTASGRVRDVVRKEVARAAAQEG